jgi:hypothetical protein
MSVATHKFKTLAAESKQQTWLAFAKEVSSEKPLLKFLHVYRYIAKNTCTKLYNNIKCDDGSILTFVAQKGAAIFAR